jgi:hypothetical protein
LPASAAGSRCYMTTSSAIVQSEELAFEISEP